VAALCAPARADDACWQMVHKAIEASAASQHALYVSYSEVQDINADGNRFMHSNASITYRDDGVAYVDDDRWTHPFTGYLLDPGPPVLGPYGDRRHAWLDLVSQQAQVLPVIANTHNEPASQCEVIPTDTSWRGQKALHLAFPHAHLDKPALISIWLDPDTLRVIHATTRDWLSFWGENGTSLNLVKYEIDVQQVGNFEVLSHVSWEYDFKWYAQVSRMVGDYAFSNYRFSEKPPVDTSFATIDQ
jgi:hypothetical protein